MNKYVIAAFYFFFYYHGHYIVFSKQWLNHLVRKLFFESNSVLTWTLLVFIIFYHTQDFAYLQIRLENLFAANKKKELT
jgi:hypothetical protein